MDVIFENSLSYLKLLRYHHDIICLLVGGRIMNDINKKGLSTTLLCCLIWGLLPLYWALLNQISSFSVLSHRIIWSGFWMLILIIATGRQQLRIDYSTYAPISHSLAYYYWLLYLSASTGSPTFGPLQTSTYSTRALAITSIHCSTYC